MERAGKFYQRRWQIGFDGRDTNVEEKEIDYVLGSGNHARTFLHRTARNTLQQLPLGWYAEKGGSWAMNPGYDQLDYQGSSERSITNACSAITPTLAFRASGGRSRRRRYSAPLPEGIDCQRCHGPGSRHVPWPAGQAQRRADPRRHRESRAPESGAGDGGVPAMPSRNHQPPAAAFDPRLNRGAFRLRSGAAVGRISGWTSTVRRARTRILKSRMRLTGLRDSQCFLKSAGKLRCTSCHNPHDIPRGEAAARRL